MGCRTWGRDIAIRPPRTAPTPGTVPLPSMYAGGLVYVPRWVAWERIGREWRSCGSGDSAAYCLRCWPWATVLPYGERPAED